MAIQSLTGNMTTNQYGGNIVCQGPTLTISPFTTFGANYLKPYRDYYTTPYYDPTDANDDGVPDNPGNILFEQQNYSGTNKDSYALNFGISASFSIPLDRGLQNQCNSAADTQINIQKQVLENKRLDWQIARIRECGKLKQEGIYLTKDSPFFNICKDVYLVPKANQVLPHTHKLKYTSHGYYTCLPFIYNKELASATTGSFCAAMYFSYSSYFTSSKYFSLRASSASAK